MYKEESRLSSAPARTRESASKEVKQGAIVVILDWDETITESDTMGTLAQAVKDSGKWQHFVDAYTTDLETHEKFYGARTCLEDQYGYLASLSAVEMTSIGRIESAKYFEGVSSQDLESAARKVTIRGGFVDFCGTLASEFGVKFEILSVNWSEEFIRYALQNVVDSSQWIVKANNLEFGQDGLCTGSVSKNKQDGIRTAIDKVEYLRIRLKQLHEKDGCLVYIGDSNTDLPCLLEADFGIIMGENSSLNETCNKYEIVVVPIEKVEKDQPEGKQTKKKLYRAKGWTDFPMQSLMTAISMAME